MHVEPVEAQPMETLESVAQAREQGRLPRVLPADWPLGHLPKVSLAAAEVTRLMHGQAVSIAENHTNAGIGAADRVRLYDEAGQFLGIGASDGHGTVRP